MICIVQRLIDIYHEVSVFEYAFEMSLFAHASRVIISTTVYKRNK